MKIQFRLRSLLIFFVLICFSIGLFLIVGKWLFVEGEKKRVEGNEGVEVARYLGQHKGDFDQAFASIRRDFLAGQLPEGAILMKQWKKPKELDNENGSVLAYRSTLVHGRMLVVKKDLRLYWE
jgi:hypothetical protein